MDDNEYEVERNSISDVERSIFNAEDFYADIPTDKQSVRSKLQSLIESQDSGIIFGPEGSGKKRSIIEDLTGYNVGYIDLKVIEDKPLQDVPEIGEEDNFLEFTADILTKDELDAYIIFNCSLLRKEELKRVLDFLEMFTDNENKIIQVWNYSDYLSLKFYQPMYLEKYGEKTIEFPYSGLKSNYLLNNSKTAKELDKTLGDKKLSSTRKRVLEVLLNGVRGEHPNYYATHYSTREITEKINERYETDLSKNTISTHISALKKFNIISDGLQDGREVKYSLKNSVIKPFIESLLYEDKYGN